MSWGAFGLWEYRGQTEQLRHFQSRICTCSRIFPKPSRLTNILNDFSSIVVMTTTISCSVMLGNQFLQRNISSDILIDLYYILVTCASSEARHKFRFAPCFAPRSSATWCNTWYTGQWLYSAIWYNWEAKSCVYSQNSIKSKAFTFCPRAGTNIICS